MAKLGRLEPRLPTLDVNRVSVAAPITGSWRDGKTSSTQRGYDYRWQKARARFLREHPLCECDDCRAGELDVKAATVVDHKVPHRGDERLFWDESNWQAMAKDCHDRKTNREMKERGFGNQP